MKNFYPDGNGLLQDYSASIHTAQVLTECFDEYENEVNRTLRPPLSSYVDPIEQLLHILDGCVIQHFLPPKYQVREYLSETDVHHSKTCRISAKVH